MKPLQALVRMSLSIDSTAISLSHRADLRSPACRGSGDHMRRDGYEVIIVSDAHKLKLDQQYQAGDTDLRTMDGFLAEFNQSFSYEFVETEQLTDDERKIFDRSHEILGLVGIGAQKAPTIRISETMWIGLDTTAGGLGLNASEHRDQAQRAALARRLCRHPSARSGTRRDRHHRRHAGI